MHKHIIILYLSLDVLAGVFRDFYPIRIRLSLENACCFSVSPDLVILISQEAQVLQLPELQLEQELFPVPGTVLGTPPSVALKTAKVDIFRRAGL
jgi:hypothetical protein